MNNPCPFPLILEIQICSGLLQSMYALSLVRPVKKSLPLALSWCKLSGLFFVFSSITDTFHMPSSEEHRSCHHSIICHCEKKTMSPYFVLSSLSPRQPFIFHRYVLHSICPCHRPPPFPLLQVSGRRSSVGKGEALLRLRLQVNGLLPCLRPVLESKDWRLYHLEDCSLIDKCLPATVTFPLLCHAVPLCSASPAPFISALTSGEVLNKSISFYFCRKKRTLDLLLKWRVSFVFVISMLILWTCDVKCCHKAMSAASIDSI